MDQMNGVGGPRMTNPAWFYLDTEKGNSVTEKVEHFKNVKDSIQDVNETFKKQLTNAFVEETNLEKAHKEDKEALRRQLQKQQQIVETVYSKRPWDKIEQEHVKIVSKTIEELKTQNFSGRSLKSWQTFYADIFDLSL